MLPRNLHLCACLVALLLGGFPFSARAYDRLYAEAIQAIDEGIPQVGIQKLRSYLAGKPTEEGRQAALLRLADALIAAGQPAAARETLQAAPDTPESRFLIVQSHLAAAEWSDALRSLPAWDTAPEEWRSRLIFARAEALRGAGKLTDAANTFALLEKDVQLGSTANLRRAEIALVSGDLVTAARVLAAPTKTDAHDLPASHYLQARLALEQRNFARAFSLFQQLRGLPRSLGSEMTAGVQIGLARAQVGLGKADDAEDTLEKFASEQPTSPHLEQILAELDHVYSVEENPSAAEMRRWTRSDEFPARQALAIFYISRFESRENGDDAAIDILQNWIEKYPAHPLLAKVLLEYGGLLCKQSHWPEALVQFAKALSLHPDPALAAQLEISSGEASFAQQKFPAAAAHFAAAAELQPGSAETLLYNSALCWLRLGDFQKFAEAYAALSSRFPDGDLRRELLVEKGRAQARVGQGVAAAQTLEQFTRDFAGHRRIAEAHLVLAELAFTSSPADPANVGVELEKTAQSHPPAEVAEQAAYLRLFQPELSAPGKEAELLTLGRAFLTTYPSSALIPDVRLKLGEIHFRQKDYANARTQFEEIVAHYPKSPLLEKACFLSAQSAIRSMNPASISSAIETLEQVVRLKGPLQLYARYEQAQIMRESGKFDEALTLFDDLLSKQPTSDLTAAALTGKGETLYLRAASDPASYPQAVQTFDQVASLPSISVYWRHLALYKKGKSLEKMDRKDDALVAWYDVLNPVVGSDEPEFFWYYRAGFDAAQLLEGREKWEAAIAIYQKMADTEGPRSAEARDRADRLRLEHFILEK